jgi:hypothetical protein
VGVEIDLRNATALFVFRGIVFALLWVRVPIFDFVLFMVAFVEQDGFAIVVVQIQGSLSAGGHSPSWAWSPCYYCGQLALRAVCSVLHRRFRSCSCVDSLSPSQVNIVEPMQWLPSFIDPNRHVGCPSSIVACAHIHFIVVINVVIVLPPPPLALSLSDTVNRHLFFSDVRHAVTRHSINHSIINHIVSRCLTGC